MRLSIALLLASCTHPTAWEEVAPAWPAELAAPPPAGLGLRSSAPFVTGEPAHFFVWGLAPGERVFVYGSRSDSGAPSCPPPGCLDLVGTTPRLGVGTANAAGAAVLSLQVPNMPGGFVWLQAITPTGSLRSDVLAARVWRAADDSDADGLSDGEEVRVYGTDPLLADTDGGGTNDGDEVANGTDPLILGDDQPGAGTVDVGTPQVDATYENLGLVWPLGPDVHPDAVFAMQFRAVGSATWLDAAPGMRTWSDTVVDGRALGVDRWATSAMFLTPGTAYELRMSVVEPGGASSVATVTASTRTPFDLASFLPSRTVFVAPGTGGGSGSVADPFRGLQEAADLALPGDRIVVGPGMYAPFTLVSSGVEGAPIVFEGPGDGTAIVDGSNTARGVVTIGAFDRVTRHVVVSGLAIRSGAWGIDAQRTQDLSVLGNTITDVDFGVYNRRDVGDERNQTVCDNVITGRTPWPGSGIPGERGIDLRGTGNVVCHNRVSDFGDCVAVIPSTGPSRGNDVHHNDVSRCVDDGVEVDYNQANVRVWRNRVFNARMGVSLQPIDGGPAYVLRNELVNLESLSFKIQNDPAGFYIVHNTGLKHGNGFGDNSSMWRNGVLRNNVFLGTRYAFEFLTVASDGFRDLDYNGWGTTRDIDPGGAWFKWDDLRYDRLVDLPAGVEDHGMEVDRADLMSASLASTWDVEVDPSSVDLRPRAALVDAGEILPNLNRVFVQDGVPDLGAFEAGAPAPTYGPR